MIDPIIVAVGRATAAPAPARADRLMASNNIISARRMLAPRHAPLATLPSF